MCVCVCVCVLSEHSQPQHVDRDTEAPLDDEVMERLNRDITEDEVKNAVRKRKNQKAGDYECDARDSGIVREHHSAILTRCFNKGFIDGTYPEEWTRVIIILLHKKGVFGKPRQLPGCLFIDCN